jgi:CRP-like cAMP-binding protein
MFANRTLAAMDADDLASLLPYLTERRVDRDSVLSQQGEKIRDVYFPTTARLRNTVTFLDGRAAETFIIGSEGVSGLSPFLADTPSGWSVEVAITGAAYHLPAKVLRDRIKVSPTLLNQFVRLLNDYLTQAAQGIACASLHHATARLARFLLVASERIETKELRLTQQDLALALAVQRTTVNASAAELKKSKAISYSRGVITIRDLPKLEAFACECYKLQQSILAAAA